MTRQFLTRSCFTLVSACLILAPIAHAQAPRPVFELSLSADRDPVVAGEELRVAVETTIKEGWHINSEDPGDEFSVPTSLEWELPDGWTQPELRFAESEEVKLDFSENPLRVWEGRVIHIASFRVPENASGETRISATMTAQACNNTQCLPPLPVSSDLKFVIAPAGVQTHLLSPWPEGSDGKILPAAETQTSETPNEKHPLDNKSLPLFLLGVFLAGLALNLTPCVFPLIPITMGFFAQSAEKRHGGTFWMALVYVIGIALTYSTLGVLAALTGQLFGAALQNPWIIGLIVLVLLGLAASMFGLWEMKAPDWANRAAGAGSGLVGALLMGLVMGFVAAPCIGPFVLGLLTLVGQKGDPFFGFISFFSLAFGLGLPYLLLGTFTGAINKLPMSGEWMLGIRKIFGIILIAMAAYFAAPLLPADFGAWLISGTLVLGGLYLLIVDRSAVNKAGIDRIMRLLSLIMILFGLYFAPISAFDPSSTELKWEHSSVENLQKNIDGGGLIIVDFYADWCLPCRELDEKTFSDPQVSKVLRNYERFKMDQTRQDEKARKAAALFGVRGVPTVIVYEDGKELFRITGFEAPERFIQRLKR